MFCIASGKSHIAKSIANTCEANLLIAQSADIMKPKLGESEKSISQMFQIAQRSRPCIILIENVEVVCPREGLIGIPLTSEEYNKGKRMTSKK